MMRATRLLVRLTGYYAVIGAVVFVALNVWPESRNYLPIGGVQELITQPAKGPLEASDVIKAAHVSNLGESLF